MMIPPEGGTTNALASFIPEILSTLLHSRFRYGIIRFRYIGEAEMDANQAKSKAPKKPPGRAASSAAAESVGGVLSSRVRELRNKKGWTLEDMSSACSVSRSMLSEIERGRANPTLAVAFRIAQAFGMSLDELVELPSVTHRLDVIRADDQGYYFRSDRYCRIRTLSPLHLEKAVEFYEIVLHSGAALKSEPHFEGAKELLTVQQGAVRVRSGDESVELSTGDSAHYPADVPHAIENLGRDDTVLFLVVTYLRD
jgi:transcriptional regulator with XRE-family HTH domain